MFVYIESIESGLDKIKQGEWRQLTSQELRIKFLRRFSIGWRIDLKEAEVSIAGVEYLFLAIDASFPNSQPRFFAPGAGNSFRWPHVERNGLLCLPSSSVFANVIDRIQLHLSDAIELLNYSAAKRRAEFEREFYAYWAQRALNPKHSPHILSLVKPGGGSRELYQYINVHSGKCIVADDKDQLKSWLRNSGFNPGDKEVRRTILIKLSRPLTPDQFPSTGRDIIDMISDDLLNRSLAHRRWPVLIFEAYTATGPVFVAVVIKGMDLKALERGFRSIDHVPIGKIRAWFKGHTLERVVVNRVDGPWIHGRDHSPDYALLSQRRVVIVGCGAIGSAVANLLAQAGVGELIFIDSDDMNSANASRHILGINDIQSSKVSGLALKLARKFPHLKFNQHFPCRFEWLPQENLEQIADADLIVSAGLDLEGEAALDAWRTKLPFPPAYVSTWAEAFALAGHAVLLFDRATLMTKFDERERPSFRLTDWSDDTRAVIVEAGCGNVFQPHGAVDLHPIIGMAARLILDALLGKRAHCCRRVWMGNKDDVEALGGKLRGEFHSSNVGEEHSW